MRSGEVEGVDTPPGRWAALLKLDVAGDSRAEGVAALRAVGEVLGRAGRAGSGRGATALVGFSARFFRGPLRRGRDESGGPATRFGITAPVPPCLRRMDARGDERFAALAGDPCLAGCESDLLVLAEAHTAAERRTLRRIVRETAALRCVRLNAVEHGARRADGRGPDGYRDGVSNLQDLRRTERERYRRYVYAGEDDAGSPALAGGTYLVYRKYVEHLDRWLSDSFTVVDAQGKAHVGEAARERAMGRAAGDGRVVHRESGEALAPQPDCAEGRFAPDESHVRHANPRGEGHTQFGAPVCPRDVRILRRSFPFRDTDPATGRVRRGLLFLCFQANIQERGFEYVHNHWLMAAGFLGCRDAFLDPAAGVIEPVDGCYYFVPPAGGGSFPGAPFF